MKRQEIGKAKLKTITKIKVNVKQQVHPQKPMTNQRPHPSRNERVSVIIPAKNEAATIRRVILACQRIEPRAEILVVANGCSDKTVKIAQAAGAKVIEIAEELGHDVGRAIGAYYAKGKILLFVDADIVIEPELLQPFVNKIRNGYDIVLNAYPRNHSKYPPHPTVTAKHALNLILGRRDLKAASMTAIPFAMTREAAQKIGYENLAIPPLAQTIAIDKGLHVGTGVYVNVGKQNRVRWRKKVNQKSNPVRDLIIGDHLEAIAYLIQKKGVRGGFDDMGRKREQLTNPSMIARLLQKFTQAFEQTLGPEATQQVTTIIPACNEANSIAKVIKNSLKAGAQSVLVIDNGSNDGTAKIAEQSGATVVTFDDRLGHDVGRAMGAKTLEELTHVIFTDGDTRIPADEIKPFVQSFQTGVDVALNDLNRILPKHRQFDSVSVLKRFLNLAIKHPELGICSLTAVPHGLSYHAIQTIGAENLAIPPLAHVIAIHKNLVVKPIHGVDVIKRNKIRPKLHKSATRPLEKLIIGDHVEAISYLQAEFGARGPFPDTIRRRDLLAQYVRDPVTTG